MIDISITFDHTMRELFTYPDPTFPLIVWAGKLTSKSGDILECHWHNEFEYFVLLSGELKLYIDGQPIHIRKGDAVFINANALHMAKPLEGRRRSCHIYCQFPAFSAHGRHGRNTFQKVFSADPAILLPGISH